jgi:formylglycine-generating enzyme required for sulfatase activity
MTGSSNTSGAGRPPDSAAGLLGLATQLEARGDLATAATVYDRAFALDPTHPEVVGRRSALLDRLAVTEHGIRFRYIPGGTFLMGSERGDPDERPVHPVELGPYWLSETPVSWSVYCALMDWEPPPLGGPRVKTDWSDLQREIRRVRASDPERAFELMRERDRMQAAESALFSLLQANKIRRQYCEDVTQRAVDWHVPHLRWRGGGGGGEVLSAESLFGAPPRDDPRRPWAYDQKPMVSVSWGEAEMLGDRISSPEARYRLPTEAEWERGARGGLARCAYPWGDEPPTAERCDFDRFAKFAIQPMRRFPPNGYGLYAMSGCVWEWTRDWYDSAYYAQSPARAPTGPEQGEAKVLRGGSWADCAEVVTVSFRMARGRAASPNVGFRLCRVQAPAAAS